MLEITKHGAYPPPFEGKTVFACVAEKRDYLLLPVKRIHVHQLEASHALVSSFALVTPCVHASREVGMDQRNSTNELVAPNAHSPCPYDVHCTHDGVGHDADMHRGGSERTALAPRQSGVGAFLQQDSASAPTPHPHSPCPYGWWKHSRSSGAVDVTL